MKVINSSIYFKANKISRKQAQHIDNILKSSSKVDIICHETTDRDAANSAVAMSDYLEQQGINTRIILYQNIKGLTLRTQNKNFIQAKNIQENEYPDTVLCVDFSQKERIAPNILNYIQKANNIVGLDHHIGTNAVTDDLTLVQKSSKEPADKISSFYVDATAKSATSVIYRFFEAMNKDISKDTAYDLFFGLISDCNKKGLVKCNGEEGTITVSKELMQDENAYEVYKKLLAKLTPKEISDMSKKIDIMSSLTDEEKAFNASLYEKLKYNNKGTIAYVEIPPNDRTWKHLGGDNTRTSAILNRFRQNVLKKFDKVKTVFVFYRAKDTYRMSIHSKEKKLKDFYDLAQKCIADTSFSTGGHEDRGGGKINSTDSKICHSFVRKIINCASFCVG